MNGKYYRTREVVSITDEKAERQKCSKYEKELSTQGGNLVVSCLY